MLLCHPLNTPLDPETKLSSADIGMAEDEEDAVQNARTNAHIFVISNSL